MTSDFHQRLEDLFHELVDRSAAERETRLETLDLEEPRLAEALRRLLVADDGSDGDRFEPSPVPRRQFGPYELVRRLGEGGMGEVWEAIQHRPVRRRVALKVLPSERASISMRRRFDAERQALATLDHPNIASFYESGTSDEGEPWFAMELVEGLPLTEFCDQNELSLDERLRLFELLCEAVQHAHRRGLIHRDLKPSNVIVTSGVGPGEPDPSTARVVVIDFGIAKALPDSSLAPGQTMHGDVLGTPEYMSPEQAGHEDGIVDTRTDVYALGVILYELLVGELPLPAEALRQAGIDEMRRRIREDEAPLPSSRLTAVADERTTEVARRRSTHPSVLVRRLRGDLDWIVLKALSKSKARRYESPLALASDLQRLRDGHAVEARAPTWHYRLGKWARRNQAAATAITVVALMTVVAAASISAALVRARAAERAALLEASQERATREFLVELFEASDPFARDPWTGERATPSELTSLQILRRGADRLLQQPVGDLLTQARLEVTVGELHLRLAEDETARKLLRSALEHLSEAGDDELGAATARFDALVALGDLQLALGETEEATSRFEQAALSAPTESVQSARAQAGLAEAQRRSFRTDEALEAAERAVATARTLALTERTAEAEEVLEHSLQVLAAVQTTRGAATDAVVAYRSLLAVQEERLGENHPRLASTYRGLSNALEVAGDYAAGGEAAQRALNISRSTLGDEHPVVAYDLLQVASSHRLRAQHEDAVLLFQEAEKILRGVRPASGALATTLAELGMSLEETGRLEAAIAAHRESMQISETIHGPEHPEVGGALSRLSSALRTAGRAGEALPYASRAFEIAEAAHPDGHWRVIFALAELVQVRLAAGDIAQAQDRSEQMMEVADRVLGPDHVVFAAAETIRAEALIAAAVRAFSLDLMNEADAALAHARAVFTEQQGEQSANLQHIAALEERARSAREEIED